MALALDSSNYEIPLRTWEGMIIFTSREQFEEAVLNVIARVDGLTGEVAEYQPKLQKQRDT